MSKKRPKMTIMLIVINIAMYLLMTVAGGSTNPNILIEFGAKDNALIAADKFGGYLRRCSCILGFNILY